MSWQVGRVFLLISAVAPLAWFLALGSISFDGVALWIAFVAAVNLLRAP